MSAAASSSPSRDRDADFALNSLAYIHDTIREAEDKITKAHVASFASAVSRLDYFISVLRDARNRIANEQGRVAAQDPDDARDRIAKKSQDPDNTKDEIAKKSAQDPDSTKDEIAKKSTQDSDDEEPEDAYERACLLDLDETTPRTVLFSTYRARWDCESIVKRGLESFLAVRESYPLARYWMCPIASKPYSVTRSVCTELDALAAAQKLKEEIDALGWLAEIDHHPDPYWRVEVRVVNKPK